MKAGMAGEQEKGDGRTEWKRVKGVGKMEKSEVRKSKPC